MKNEITLDYGWSSLRPKMRGTERLADLYATHGPAALRLAYLLTRDRGVAEDIVQDAFVRLFGRFADIRSADRFEPYLKRIVVNLSIDRARKLSAERSRNERQWAAQSREGSLLPDIETQHAVAQALGGLPPRQRAALILRFYEDLTERQIADVLHCSVSAVKALLSRGLNSLKDGFGGEEWM